MGCGERRVKRLDAELRRVLIEAAGAHQRECPEATNVAVVKVPSVIETEANRRVWRFGLGQRAAGQEERAGEPRLNDDPLARVQIEDDQLGATPSAHEAPSGDVRCELLRRSLTKNVRPNDRDLGDAATSDLAMEV